MKNSLFLVSVVADRHPKLIFKNKKVINLDLSPPCPNPGVEEGDHRRPRREGGGAIGRRCCRSRKEATVGHAEREEEPSAAVAQICLSIAPESHRLGGSWRSPRPRHRHRCFGGGPTPPLSRPGHATLEDLGGAVGHRCIDPPCLPDRGGGKPSSWATA
jgi:hypothetical protein